MEGQEKITDQKITDLEQLELEFQKFKNSKKKDKKKIEFRKINLSRGQRKVALTIGMFFIVIIFVCIGLRACGSKSDAPQFLSVEDKENWENKEVDENEIFIMVNTNLQVEGQSVNLHLANPPYCAYPLKVTVKDKEGETMYFQSEILNPGQYLEDVKFENLPKEKGNYDVTIYYSFYAEKGSDTVVGEHTVSAEMFIP